MLYTLSIGNDIKFSVLDLLRNIGMGLVNIIYSTIDVLYEVAYKINSLDMIEMLKNVHTSYLTKLNVLCHHHNQLLFHQHLYDYLY